MDSDDDRYMEMMIRDAENEYDDMENEVDMDVLAEMEAAWDKDNNNNINNRSAKSNIVNDSSRYRRLDFNNNNNNNNNNNLNNNNNINNYDRDKFLADMTMQDELTILSDIESDEINESSIINQSTFDNNENEDLSEYILERAPSGHYMTVTAEDGRRIYLNMSSKSTSDAQLERDTRQYNANRRLESDIQLTNIPVTELIKQLDAEALVQELEEKEIEEEKKQSIDTNKVVDDDELWVSKYAPNTYFDLLSDEKINRDVLAWLKTWSPIVFDQKKDDNDNAESFFVSPRKRHARELQKKMKHKELKDHPKILLLAGPPGLGKTTLAHVIAKQLGYRPVEFNASDDRTASVLITKIKNAVEMQSMFGEAKPNCVILDEIDGAMGDDNGAINALVKLVLGGGKGKNGKKLPPLNRPIICTCNNAYVKALKPLRAIASIQHFTSINKNRLMQRILNICKNENIKIDRSVVASLSEMCNYDIRSCLNALQFLSTKSKNGRISTKDLENAPISAKDETRDSKTTIRSIFQTSNPDTKMTVGRKKHHLLMHKNNDIHFATILNTIEIYGKYDNLIDMCSHNYTLAPYGDPTITRSVNCTEWISFSDIISCNINSKQNFMMTGYLPYCIMGVHINTATQRSFRPQTMTHSYYAKQLKNQSNNIIDSMLSNGSLLAHSGLSRSRIVLDMISPLLDILSPIIRPVNFQLLNNQEKLEVQQLVDTMISLNITYKLKRSFNRLEVPTLNLEPPIDNLARFDHLQRKIDDNVSHWLQKSQNKPKNIWKIERRQLSPLLMELLKREIDYELVRRRAYTNDNENNNENNMNMNNNMFSKMINSQKENELKQLSSNKTSPSKKQLTSPLKNQLTSPSKKQIASPFKKQTASPNTLMSLIKSKYDTPKNKKKKANKGKKKRKLSKISPASKRKRTFLHEHENKLAQARSKMRKTYPVRYKFNEGFTNAVRRPITIRDFIS